MLPVNWETIRLSLHVLAATIWVGGQLTLAALVPALRTVNPDVPRRVARRFAQVAWPAFVVLLATGIWNIAEVNDERAGGIHGSYRTTLIVKLVLVVVSGITAYVHARARTRGMLASFGVLTALSALAALFLGVQLGDG